MNIGSRQSGRLKAACIIDCEAKEAAITAAIDHALSPEFLALLSEVQSLYGKGDSAKMIKEILKTINLGEILKKKFYDVSFDENE